MDAVIVAELHKQVVAGREKFPSQVVLILFHAAANPSAEITPQWVTGKMLCCFTTAQRYVWLLKSGKWIHRGRLTPKACRAMGLLDYECEV